MGYTTGNKNDNDNGSNRILWLVLFLAGSTAFLIAVWTMLPK